MFDITQDVVSCLAAIMFHEWVKCTKYMFELSSLQLSKCLRRMAEVDKWSIDKLDSSNWCGK